MIITNILFIIDVFIKNRYSIKIYNFQLIRKYKKNKTTIIRYLINEKHDGFSIKIKKQLFSYPSWNDF